MTMAAKTKTTKTAAATTAETTTKTAAKPAAKAAKVSKPVKFEPTITFGSWVARARARADKTDANVLPLLVEMKGDKKIGADAKLVNVAKRYGDKPGFAAIEKRYLAANAIAVRQASKAA